MLKRFAALKIIAACALGGTAFAGYLTFFKYITGTCALGESCPYVLGLPACIYGFALFLAMAAVAVAALLRRIEDSWPERVIQTVGIAGTAFALWLTYQDLGPWLSSGGSYTLILPSCFYGLIFYVVVLTLATKLVIRARRGGQPESGEHAPSKDEAKN
jgi:uncharacterized membrane protein